jgi:hypothetical protein
MDHTALGPRWVYDGLGDPVLVSTYLAAALTGTGQAVGIVEDAGRRFVVPSAVRLGGGGWTGGPVAVDGFELIDDVGDLAILRSDRFELRLARRPQVGPPPAIGLTATVNGASAAIVLAEAVAIDG